MELLISSSMLWCAVAFLTGFAGGVGRIIRLTSGTSSDRGGHGNFRIATGLCSGLHLVYRRMRGGFGIMRLFVELYSQVGRIRKVSLINWI